MRSVLRLESNKKFILRGVCSICLLHLNWMKKLATSYFGQFMNLCCEPSLYIFCAYKTIKSIHEFVLKSSKVFQTMLYFFNKIANTYPLQKRPRHEDVHGDVFDHHSLIGVHDGAQLLALFHFTRFFRFLTRFKPNQGGH